MTRGNRVVQQKIFLKDEGTSHNKNRTIASWHNNRGSLSKDTISSQAKPNKISAIATRTTSHTVTHVTHISLVHCPKEGLDFILSHLSEPIWPRTVSTKATDGRQVIVNSHEEALAYFKAANYLDCRINAYPFWRPSILSDFLGIKNTVPPNFIMIDLDLSNFNGEANTIRTTLRKTLKIT
jgi:hypothetical protein